MHTHIIYTHVGITVAHGEGSAGCTPTIICTHVGITVAHGEGSAGCTLTLSTLMLALQ